MTTLVSDWTPTWPVGGGRLFGQERVPKMKHVGKPGLEKITHVDFILVLSTYDDLTTIMTT